MPTAITFSEFSAMLDCPKKWWFSYNQRLEPLKPSSKLDLGKVVHEAVEAYLRDKTMSIEAIDSLLDSRMKEMSEAHLKRGGFPYKDEDTQEARDLSRSMMRQFIKYSTANDDFKVISLEEEFDIPVINTNTGEEVPDLRLMGKIDGRVQINGHNFILEHKTAASCEGDYWWKNLNQVDFYTYAMSRKHGVKFSGAIINYLVKKIPAIPEVLKSGQLSRDKRIVTTEEIYLGELTRLGLNPVDYADVIGRIKARGEQFTIRKTVYRHQSDLADIENTIWWVANRKLKMQFFPKNKSDQCSWKCGFKEICIDDTPEARDALYRTKSSEHQELKGTSDVTEV